MRKRYTRRYRQGPPVRYKWTARADAELRGWEHDLRHGEIDDAIEDARPEPPSIPWEQGLAELIRQVLELGVLLYRDATAIIRRLSHRLADFVPAEEIYRLCHGQDED